MANQGQLIALEGTGGAALVQASKRLQRQLRQGRKPAPPVCTWDASGIFHEIREGARGIPGASPRTLLLLYAADLAFRLRWQIRPALESGITVIAAPYLETAIGFGRAAGLSSSWLKDLLSFAPAPSGCYRSLEITGPASKMPKAADSYLEFCFQQLRNTEGRWNTDEIRAGFLAHLAGLENKGKCVTVAAVKSTKPVGG
ncbi:MAG: hypothetical protein NTZ56_05595 [Acidobacteria bacterium]|nr:hypothetical protein [Acidobacteriota bacterium]